MRRSIEEEEVCAEEGYEEEEYEQPRFTVTMKKEPVFNKPAGSTRPGGFKSGRGGGGGGGGSEGGRAPGGSGGGRGGKFNREKKPDVSADDLDSALASYLTNRPVVKDD